MEELAPKCLCGNGRMKSFTSKTVKNPDREFFRCPLQLRHKKAFLWAYEVDEVDEVVPGKLKLKKRNVHEEEDVPNQKEKMHNTNEVVVNKWVVVGEIMLILVLVMMVVEMLLFLNLVVYFNNIGK